MSYGYNPNGGGAYPPQAQLTTGAAPGYTAEQIQQAWAQQAAAQQQQAYNTQAALTAQYQAQNQVPGQYQYQTPGQTQAAHANRQPKQRSRMRWAALGSLTTAVLMVGGCAADALAFEGRYVQSAVDFGIDTLPSRHGATTVPEAEQPNPTTSPTPEPSSSPSPTADPSPKPKPSPKQVPRDASCEKKPYPNTSFGRYYHKYCAEAQHTQDKYGVPMLVTLAMSSHETGFGKSELAKKANNFFGMKVNGGWKGPSYTVVTSEYVTPANLHKYPNRVVTRRAGNMYYIEIPDKFRKFSSAGQSFDSFGEYLKTRHDAGGRFYADAFRYNDPKKFVQHLVDPHEGRQYATDPAYAVNVGKKITKFAAIHNG